MDMEQGSLTNELPQPKIIPNKEYQGRTVEEKCINGYIHRITVDVYCCPFERIVVKDEQTDKKCP